MKNCDAQLTSLTQTDPPPPAVQLIPTLDVSIHIKTNTSFLGYHVTFRVQFVENVVRLCEAATEFETFARSHCDAGVVGRIGTCE